MLFLHFNYFSTTHHNNCVEHDTKGLDVYMVVVADVFLEHFGWNVANGPAKCFELFLHSEFDSLAEVRQLQVVNVASLVYANQNYDQLNVLG